ncbi:MAG: hypothetical protein A2946_03735 [Candidatus Liptonbacteria bacterium RIFCSPLOWO2_01_FULL_53_13]|uniref:DUF1648 domain-containing protein n=1 Tax=Candidatus Liptonbacteria bacterium RIFCSPLOWO2_01_FULL_53_13 TaxID=1798651 RepID=A0A1G2CLD9_9BACT|nr:MAG: hypothetical protein A2946_03735 [Candidatus Liptonbacteria bacterium RIFCSPLOWO2_01_FULL_53_13]
MKLRKGEIISLILVLMSFAVAWYFYPQLPERIASHWDARGEVNGYTGRFWGAFLTPMILVVMFLVLVIVPRIDPKRENIEKFRAHFDRFIVLLFLFMLYLYGLTLAWNLGYVFDLMKFLAPAFAVLFYSAGMLIQHAEPNWTIGIRTPWTLSNPEVWERTHRLAQKLFKASGILALLGFFFPDYFIWFILIPVIVSSVWAVVYSYLEYRKLGGLRT